MKAFKSLFCIFAAFILSICPIFVGCNTTSAKYVKDSFKITAIEYNRAYMELKLDIKKTGDYFIVLTVDVYEKSDDEESFFTSRKFYDRCTIKEPETLTMTYSLYFPYIIGSNRKGLVKFRSVQITENEVSDEEYAIAICLTGGFLFSVATVLFILEKTGESKKKPKTVNNAQTEILKEKSIQAEHTRVKNSAEENSRADNDEIKG